MATDPDYKGNQRDAQKVWRDANPDYYKEYRKKNDAYTKKNRTRQADRNKNRRVHLQNQAPNLIANMDALIVQLTVMT
jgi:hypothetical protein